MAEGLARDLGVGRNVRGVLDELDGLDVQLQVQIILEPTRGFIVLCHVASSFFHAGLCPARL